MSPAEPSNAQRELVQALYRISGLVDAVFAIGETCANAEIAEGAMAGVQKTLEREVDALLSAAEAGLIIAAENVKEEARGAAMTASPASPSQRSPRGLTGLPRASCGRRMRS